jgi:hypothetical protein
MHTPTKIRINGRECLVTDHAERPDGVLHLACEALELVPDRVELFEGDEFLTSGRPLTASLEIAIEPRRAI